MKFTEKSLPGVLLIEPMVFEDDRGFFMETY
ncbi:MAG: dTDP-4-dehydrorhamnose 3,5-epimerase family protein, partial [Desulfobacteraceae bacterium]|nr:dTDP-4-dehydrorhamnose 3,5-epimerase family protein [Desulfobacteraceae bacterium]